MDNIINLQGPLSLDTNKRDGAMYSFIFRYRC